MQNLFHSTILRQGDHLSCTWIRQGDHLSCTWISSGSTATWATEGCDCILQALLLVSRSHLSNCCLAGIDLPQQARLSFDVLLGLSQTQLCQQVHTSSMSAEYTAQLGLASSWSHSNLTQSCPSMRSTFFGSRRHSGHIANDHAHHSVSHNYMATLPERQR